MKCTYFTVLKQTIECNFVQSIKTTMIMNSQSVTNKRKIMTISAPSERFRSERSKSFIIKIKIFIASVYLMSSGD